MSEREWGRADPAMVTARWIRTDDHSEQYAVRVLSGWTSRGGVHVADWETSAVRPLLVIDAEGDIQALADALREVCDGYISNDATRAALRSLLAPRPWTEWDGSTAPWPEVFECHSKHVDGHECPQCAWEHEHVWVAWTKPNAIGGGPGIPIRCIKCGGRKCDAADCALQRHTHTHEGVTT